MRDATPSPPLTFQAWATSPKRSARSPITASRCCPACRSRYHRALPGLPEDDAQSRYIEIDAGRHDHHRHLPAERQFRRRGGLRLQARLDGPAGASAPRRCWRRTRRSSSPATSTSARPMRISPPARCRPRDALVRPETRARFRRLLWLGLTDAVRAVHPHGAGLHVLGLPGRRLAARHAACASTTPCCRRRWPNGWWPPRRTARSGPSRSRRITCPSSLRLALSKCDGPASADPQPSHPKQRQPPPVRRHPDIAVAVPTPVSFDIVRQDAATVHRVPADPDIPIAVPVPVTRLPDNARPRGGGTTSSARRWHRAIRDWAAVRATAVPPPRPSRTARPQLPQALHARSTPNAGSQYFHLR